VARGYPVLFGTFIPQRCYETAGQTGVIPTTTSQERGQSPQGGHCILIVGYDIDKKVFLVRNSWRACQIVSPGVERRTIEKDLATAES